MAMTPHGSVGHRLGRDVLSVLSMGGVLSSLLIIAAFIGVVALVVLASNARAQAPTPLSGCTTFLNAEARDTLFFETAMAPGESLCVVRRPASPKLP